MAHSINRFSEERSTVIPVKTFIASLQELGVGAFTGVPCSYLKPLLSEVSRARNYIAAASEGEAIGMDVDNSDGGVDLILFSNIYWTPQY